MDPATLLESHGAVDQRPDRVVLAEPDVLAGLEAGAALTHEDRARGDLLSAVALDAAELSVGVAAVTA